MKSQVSLDVSEDPDSGEARIHDRSRPRDVVFTFSYVTWDGARRRGMNFAQDRLVEALITHPRVRRLVVANPFRSLPRRAARRVLGREEPFPNDGRATLYGPLRLRRADPNSIAAVERAYRTYDRGLHRAAARAGLERPALITMHPLIAGFAPLDWAGPVTFFASDDWTAAPEYRRWWPAYEEAYARVRDRGHALCAVSEAIVARVAPTGPHAVVPNGVEPAEWLDIPTAPRWFARLAEPRILYVGTLDTRLDVARIAEIARAFPAGSVTLVGRVTDERHVAPLRDLPNVHFPGPVPRHAVPSVVAAASACIVPHVRTRFTEAMSPLKAYEYLAAGRSVAAVDLPPLRGIDPRVVLCLDGGDFAGSVRQALDLGPATEAERRLFLKANAWGRRHERVLDLAMR